MIQTYWRQLKQREKIAIKWGSIVAVSLLFYSLIWHPVLDESAQLLKTIQHQSVELSWLQHASLRIKRLQAEGFVSGEQESGSALVLVQQGLLRQYNSLKPIKLPLI